MGYVEGGDMSSRMNSPPPPSGLNIILHDDTGFFPIVSQTFVHWRQINWKGVCIGVVVMAFLKFSTQYKISLKRAKADSFFAKCFIQFADFKELIIVVLTGSFVWFLKSEHGENSTQDNGLICNVVGTVPQGLPPFRPPWEVIPHHDLDKWGRVIKGSFLIAMTSYLTTWSSSKRVALQQGYHIKASQEAVALGFAGIAGGFFCCFPVSGSLSRAALLPQVGIKSQVGGIVATCVVAGGLVFFSGAIYWIPKCTLAGIIILACTKLQDFDYLFWLIKTSKVTDKVEDFTSRKLLQGSAVREGIPEEGGEAKQEEQVGGD